MYFCEWWWTRFFWRTDKWTAVRGLCLTGLVSKETSNPRLSPNPFQPIFSNSSRFCFSRRKHKVSGVWETGQKTFTVNRKYVAVTRVLLLELVASAWSYLLKLVKFSSFHELFTKHIHSFSSLSYDRSKASSKAGFPHSAIQSFLLKMRVSSPFLKVIR